MWSASQASSRCWDEEGRIQNDKLEHSKGPDSKLETNVKLLSNEGNRVIVHKKKKKVADVSIPSFTDTRK